MPSFALAVGRSQLLPWATAALALALFVADIYTPPDCLVSGLDVVVILMAGNFCRGRQLWLVCAACAGLTIAAQVLSHRYVLANDQAAYIGAFNTSVSLLTFALATFLVLRGQAAAVALRRAQADLARVTRITTMGELTASIAHEVNQPIAGVVTNASACLRWLGGETPNLEEARVALARIVRDGTRAADVIARIRLIFTRAEPERTPINLNQLTRETLDLLGGEAGRTATALRADLASDLPPVVGDRIQIQQVLVNLILNALDATREADAPREVTVRSRRSSSGEVELSVSDTGAGLPAGETEALFDAFFTTKPHGTGLGLSISRSIIEAHRGRLSAAANNPRGATFLVALPVEPVAAVAA